MTQREFNKDFKELNPLWPHYTLTDRRVAYNNMIELARCNGQITDKQARTWGHPPFLTSKQHLIDGTKY